MPKATRTLNPLHFEDLEPHRFEDLVRQLAYAFRAWHSLEAAARLGADDGIDIRGIERRRLQRALGEDDDPDEAVLAAEYRDLEWRIQCKRERRIGPSAMETIVGEILRDDSDTPYGVVVAAASDFSKRTRDVFRSMMLEAGVEEFFVWGKAELEDMLFRPANDHLLWAYFGVSIRVRRSSQATMHRSRLATKRKLVNVIGEVARRPSGPPVLLRDIEAQEYPWPVDVTAFRNAPSWRYYRCRGHIAPDYLGFVVSDYAAWWNQDEGQYDVCSMADNGWPRHPELVGVSGPDYDAEDRIHRFDVMRVPEEHQARYQVIGLVHYDQIVVVDEFGDSYHDGPHLLLDFEGRASPFRKEVAVLVKHGYGGGTEMRAEEQSKAEFFPDPIPDIADADWKAYLDSKKQ